MIVNITNVKKDFGKGGGREKHNKTKYLLYKNLFYYLKNC